MLILYQFPYKFGFNSSPFCLKIETILNILKLPFKIETDYTQMKMPKNKLPVIEDTETDSIIADSEFILEYIEKKYEKSLNNNLSNYQKSISYAFKKMIEEHLYWVALYSRWFDEVNWETTKKAYFDGMPEPMIKEIYNKTKRDFEGCGIGLHSKEEIYALGIKDLKAISTFLYNKEGFAFENQLSELDIIIYSFVGQIIWAKEITSPLKNYIEKEEEQVILNYINFIKNFLSSDVKHKI